MCFSLLMFLMRLIYFWQALESSRCCGQAMTIPTLQPPPRIWVYRQGPGSQGKASYWCPTTLSPVSSHTRTCVLVPKSAFFSLWAWDIYNGGVLDIVLSFELLRGYSKPGQVTWHEPMRALNSYLVDKIILLTVGRVLPVCLVGLIVRLYMYIYIGFSVCQQGGPGDHGRLPGPPNHQTEQGVFCTFIRLHSSWPRHLCHRRGLQ